MGTPLVLQNPETTLLVLEHPHPLPNWQIRSRSSSWKMVDNDGLFRIFTEASQEGKCREQNGTEVTKPISGSHNVMCSGYHNLHPELCYTTMCTALNSPKASVPLTHDESNKFPLKSIHINSCLWLTMLPQFLAPRWGTAFSVSIGKYQVKY